MGFEMNIEEAMAAKSQVGDRDFILFKLHPASQSLNNLMAGDKGKGMPSNLLDTSGHLLQVLQDYKGDEKCSLPNPSGMKRGTLPIPAKSVLAAPEPMQTCMTPCQ